MHYHPEDLQNILKQAETTINTLHEYEDPQHDVLIVLLALSKIIRDRDNNT